MKCEICGTENLEEAKYCKSCGKTLAPELLEGPAERLKIGYSDRAIALIMIAIGVVLGIIAILPFYLLDTKDLITMESMLLIVSMPLGLISFASFLVGCFLLFTAIKKEAAIEKAREKHWDLIESAVDGIFALDKEGKFTFMNQAALDRLGYSKDEVIGKKFTTVVAPECHEMMLENFKRRFTRESCENLEIRVITKSGERIPVELRTCTIERYGEFTGVEGVARDLTELKKAEKKYRDMIDLASDAIFTLDRNGNFTYVNKKGTDLLGYSQEELIGKHFTKVVAPEDLEFTLENFKKRIAGEEALERYKISVISKNMDKIPIELSTRTLDHEGDFMGLEGIAREIL